MDCSGDGTDQHRLEAEKQRGIQLVRQVMPGTSASCEDIQGIRPQAKTAHERKIKVVAAGVLHSVFFPPIFIFQSTKVTSLVLCDVHKLT